MHGLDYTALWALALSVITPLATSVVQQPTWSRTRRTTVGAIVSIVVGVVTAALAGDLTSGMDLLTAIGVVLVGSEAFYQKLWKGSGVTETIEAKTSPTPASQNADGSYVVTDASASPAPAPALDSADDYPGRHEAAQDGP
jgi:hypothetical protein